PRSQVKYRGACIASKLSSHKVLHLLRDRAVSATQHGSKSANQSAKRLGVSRNTLYKRLRERQG
ncbi:hypothetical protein KDX24_28025, partial [Pseudomonas sp. CDFA 550]|nr:hypothetical protein [Pseudomonas quasicaspiana]